MLLQKPTQSFLLVSHEQIEKHLADSELFVLVNSVKVLLLDWHDDISIFNFVHELITTLSVLRIHKESRLVLVLHLIGNLIVS